MQVDEKSKAALEDIINRLDGMKSMQDGINEDIKAVAEYLGVKPGEIKRVITLVNKERKKGDVIEAEQDILDTAVDLVNRTKR
jgi:hypothetical protein